MTQRRRRRILQSLTATVFDRVVTIGCNILLVPILLSAWGADRYGEWIILTAFATIASLSQLGVVQASSSEIISNISSGNREGARKVFSLTVALLAAISGIVMVAAIGVLAIADLPGVLGIRTIKSESAALVLLLVLASVLCAFFVGPLSSAIGAMVGAGLSTALCASLKLCEAALLSVVVILGHGPVFAAGVLALSAFANVAAHAYLTRRHLPWLTVTLRSFDWTSFRQLLRLSGGQFLFSLSSNLIAIQLPRIVLGYVAGPATVAVFSVSVTYARMARVVAGILGQSLQLELTRAYAEKRLQTVRNLLVALCQVSLWCALLLVMGLQFSAPYLMEVWTRGHIAADPLLIALLGAGALLGAYCDAMSYFLLGINRVGRLGIFHCASALVAVTLGVAGFRYFGTAAMAGALILPEAVTAAVAALIVGRTLSMQKRQLLQTFKFPGGLLREEAGNVLRRVRSALRGPTG